MEIEVFKITATLLWPSRVSLVLKSGLQKKIIQFPLNLFAWRVNVSRTRTIKLHVNGDDTLNWICFGLYIDFNPSYSHSLTAAGKGGPIHFTFLQRSRFVDIGRHAWCWSYSSIFNQFQWVEWWQLWSPSSITWHVDGGIWQTEHSSP